MVVAGKGGRPSHEERGRRNEKIRPQLVVQMRCSCRREEVDVEGVEEEDGDEEEEEEEEGKEDERWEDQVNEWIMPSLAIQPFRSSTTRGLNWWLA